jgi:hypothetical protein
LATVWLNWWANEFERGDERLFMARKFVGPEVGGFRRTAMGKAELPNLGVAKAESRNWESRKKKLPAETKHCKNKTTNY